MTDSVFDNEGGDVFDALVENRRIRRAAAVQELVLIARACDEWRVTESGAGEACERLVEGGAEGTAHVGEFLALELAGLLEISPTSAALRIRETLNLRDRHPELWAVTLGGRAEPWRALQVAAECAAAHLSAEAARWVDHQLCLVLSALPWSRALRSLKGLIAAADPALAAQRARQAHERRYVFVGDYADGGATLVARLDAEDALSLDQAIDQVADALASAGSPECEEQRRATALGVLADPQASLELLTRVCGPQGDAPCVRPANRREATLVVHIAADAVNASPSPDSEGGSEPSGVARVEGVGALDTDTLRRFLGGCRVTVRPVTDLAGIPPVDAYEIPNRLRAAVAVRNPVEVFPYGTRAARRCDLDHTVPFDHRAGPGSGQTRLDNLGPLSRRVHRAKTAGVWAVEQTHPGVFLWTSPHGHRYEVSPNGTVPLGRSRTRLRSEGSGAA